MRSFSTLASALVLIGVALIIGIRPVIAQQSFSCPHGTQASCLDYNDKVCAFLSKCVSQDAVCFDSYTCDYKGFICKSKYDQIVNDYNNLLLENKRLVSSYNSLRVEHQENVDDYNSLLRKHTNAKSCITYANTLEEAKNCT